MSEESYDDLLRARRERRAREQTDVGFFAGQEDEKWPERPPVEGAEQRSLALPESPEARYAAWRRTPESHEVLTLLRTIAKEWITQGMTKIGPRGLWEEARHRLKRSVDNRLQALACREVEDTTPELHGRFRHRLLKAS